MRRMFEFVCEDGHISEALVDETVRELACRACGKNSTRIVSMVRSRLESFIVVHFTIIPHLILLCQVLFLDASKIEIKVFFCSSVRFAKGSVGCSNTGSGAGSKTHT